MTNVVAPIFTPKLRKVWFNDLPQITTYPFKFTSFLEVLKLLSRRQVRGTALSQHHGFPSKWICSISSFHSSMLSGTFSLRIPIKTFHLKLAPLFPLSGPGGCEGNISQKCWIVFNEYLHMKKSIQSMSIRRFDQFSKKYSHTQNIV